MKLLSLRRWVKMFSATPVSMNNTRIQCLQYISRSYSIIPPIIPCITKFKNPNRRHYSSFKDLKNPKRNNNSILKNHETLYTIQNLSRSTQLRDKCRTYGIPTSVFEEAMRKYSQKLLEDEIETLKIKDLQVHVQSRQSNIATVCFGLF